MGICLSFYQLDELITAEEIIIEAENIGGLAISYDKKSKDCQFTDEPIGSSVTINIDTERKTVSLTQYSRAGCILYRLLNYTLRQLGASNPHSETIIGQPEEFPICVQTVKKQERNQTLFALMLMPFFLVGFIVMALFYFILGVFSSCMNAVNVLSRFFKRR